MPLLTTNKYGADDLYIFDPTDPSAFLVAGVTYYATGDFSTAMYSQAADTELVIAGTLYGRYIAFQSAGSGTTVINVLSGGVLSGDDRAINLYTDQNVVISNSGLIEAANGEAIYVAGASQGDFTLLNSGTIRGGTYYAFETLYGGDTEIINTGTIVGDVYLHGNVNTIDTHLGVMAGVIHGSSGTNYYTIAGTERIEASAGYDVIFSYGGVGDDVLTGALGDDVFSWGASDTGFDIVNGGAGSNTLRGSANNAVIGVTSFTNISAITGVGFTNVTVLMTGAADVIDLTGVSVTGIALIDAAGGDDSIIGSLGDDALSGGAGVDYFVGGDGGDTLGGGAENDSLLGNDGADCLTGDDGADFLWGGAGADTMIGGVGDDWYVIEDAGDVAVENVGGGGDMLETYINWVMGANVEYLVMGGVDDLTAVGNALNNQMWGNDGDNVLEGGAGVDALRGRLGADTVRGGDGVDQLFGNEGDDRLEGEDGNDLMNGGEGADTMVGGAGSDIYTVDDANDVIIETGSDANDEVRTFIDFTLTADIERLALQGSSAINGTGNALNNLITGNASDNLLDGMDGDDNIQAGSGDDTLLGGAGRDTLGGQTGDDVLSGGDGAEILNGGSGSDTMTGGAGADLFRFDLIVDSAVGSTRDMITDFEGAADKIDLGQIDANANAAGNQAFAFIAGAAFGGVAGQLRYSGGVVQGDVNGDGVADFEIQLSGSPTIASSDFLL